MFYKMSVGNNCQVYVYLWVGCGWGTFSVLLRLVFISHPHNEYTLFLFQTCWDEISSRWDRVIEEIKSN